MIIDRAMSDMDMKHYHNGENILCTLLNSYLDINNRSKDEQKDILECCHRYFEQEREQALNGTIGHVNGAKFKCDRSPYISTSPDFDFVVSEYAMPQAGTYNWYNKRKPIAIIDYDDDKIYENIAKICSLKRTYNEDFAINLNDSRLKKLYDLGIIENETSFGYRITNDRKIIKTTIPGINNFSTAASEILIYKEIKREDIKLIIYPIIQDILYSCNVDINRKLDFIRKNCAKINKTITEMLKNYPDLCILYPSIDSGIPLTDILEERYIIVNGNTIEKKYEKLKEYKRKLLILLVKELNATLKTNWQVTRLVDDKVIACSYNNAKKYSKKQQHDIILIEKDQEVYKYSHEESAYVSKNKQKIKI